MKDDVFVMASIRHPIEHFLSVYKFSMVHKHIEKLHGKKLSKFDGMRILLKNSDLIQKAYALSGISMPLFQLIRPNVQLLSLGITKFTGDIDAVYERTKEIDFFVIAEQFDESMVVLSNELHADQKYFVYNKFTVNRSQKERDETVPEDIKKLILEFNKGDMILYSIGKQRLHCHMQNIPDMEGALTNFRKILSDYKVDCATHKAGCLPANSSMLAKYVQNFNDQIKWKTWNRIAKIVKETS